VSRHQLVRTGDVPADWREIPEWEHTGGAELQPNYFCRARNAARMKYCSSRAGAGTDHLGQGRCKRHGGASPKRHGLYSKIIVTRLAELLDDAASIPDPLSLLPELALLRVIVVDFINRHEVITAAVLAWHNSFGQTQRPIPEPMRLAFESMVDEFEILLAEHGDGDEDARAANVKLARAFIRYMSGQDGEPKPRKMLDIADAHRILDTISKLVERVENGRAKNGLSREQVKLVVNQLGAATANRISEAFDTLRNRGIDVAIERDGVHVDADLWLSQVLKRDWRAAFAGV
jgi:hypothetical protein